MNGNLTVNQTIEAAQVTAVNDQAETPANTKFHMQEAVHTAFWGKHVGRVVSISFAELPYYEVQLANGRIVLEPEIYLKSAPNYEAVLPSVELRPSLTMRQIDQRLDTPGYGGDDRSRPYAYLNGEDTFINAL